MAGTVRDQPLSIAELIDITGVLLMEAARRHAAGAHPGTIGDCGHPDCLVLRHAADRLFQDVGIRVRE